MLVKIVEKKRALNFRQRGYSVGEISRILNVSKSTISLWTNDAALTNTGHKRMENTTLISKMKSYASHHKNKLERITKANVEAQRLLKDIGNDGQSDMVVLSMLYWCEGAKEDVSVRFTNSDPNIIRIFLKLLRNSFKIDEKKISVIVHLHDYHDEDKICAFWSTVTGIPRNQFNKSFTKKSDHKYKKEGYKGCVRINYHDSHVARVILSFAKRFMKLYI